MLSARQVWFFWRAVCYSGSELTGHDDFRGALSDLLALAWGLELQVADKGDESGCWVWFKYSARILSEIRLI